MKTGACYTGVTVGSYGLNWFFFTEEYATKMWITVQHVKSALWIYVCRAEKFWNVYSVVQAENICSSWSDLVNAGTCGYAALLFSLILISSPMKNAVCPAATRLSTGSGKPHLFAFISVLLSRGVQINHSFIFHNETHCPGMQLCLIVYLT